MNVYYLPERNKVKWNEFIKVSLMLNVAGIVYY